MDEAGIRRHLECLEKPLRYATQNNFAHLAKLRGLESYMHHHLRALQALHLPAPWTALLEALAHTCEGIDALLLADKRQRVQHAEELLQQLYAALPTVSSPLPVAPPVSAAVSPAPRATENIAASDTDPFLQPVQFLRGVGPKRAALLAKLSLHTVHDLLWFLPLRYEDRRQMAPLGCLQPGKRDNFCGRVIAVQTHPGRRGRPFVSLMLQDSGGALTCKWFQARPAYIQERFPVGTRVVGSGLITVNAYTGLPEVVHPDLEVLDDDDTDLTHFGRVVPIYPLTAGLHQKSIRSLMKAVIDAYVPQIQETLPTSIRQDHGLCLLAEAFRQVHFPDDASTDLDRFNSQNTPFHTRLVFEEFFLLELGLALRHRLVQREPRQFTYHHQNQLGETLIGHLPFTLTAAQQRVLGEIVADMQQSFPMNRLIQGDVGSGKTIVALLAMLLAVSNGFQATMMAPTEILAEQHLATLRQFLQPLNLEVQLLTGAVKGKSRQQVLERIARGEVPLVVGTHALLYDEVQFHSLSMVVVDEQHRFGVLQRASLRRKGLTPDVLVMTATPIPRTLAMTLYGDLDLSVLDELPPQRLPVRTSVLSAAHRERAYETIRREVKKGRQAYIVYPLIEESDTLDLGAAVAMVTQLQQEIFPQWKVGLLHGRLPSEEKDAIMQAFVQREVQILISTTVIEVGVDVANATVMLIENAEHFGLAQLHQLRGRVGRGAAQSYCMMLAGQALSKEGRQRLRVMQESNDGFYVAEQDLQIRGPGELLGTRQAGLPELRVGNVLHHSTCLEQARRAAFDVIAADPDLQQAEHQALATAAQVRWQGRLELAGIG